MFSLIIPAYNEEKTIERVVREAHRVLTSTGEDFEIIIVDDHSTDRTGVILSSLSIPQLHIVNHAIVNRGYGAAIKAGIRRSKGEEIGIIDADGTYPIDTIPHLLRRLRAEGADMVVGARVNGSSIPWTRRPAKAVVGWLSNWLTGMKIPDVNSGLRVLKRELAERFMHLFPQRFSLTLTLTLAALTSDYIVLFEPIEYFKREGTSMLGGARGPYNFVNFLSIVIRIVTYFRPLRFFIWPTVILLLFGIIMSVYDQLTIHEFSNTSERLLLSGLQVGLFGLLAEVVVRSRKEG